MRKLIAAALAGGLLIGLLSPAYAKPMTVMTDAAGDAGNQDSGVPGADQAGFDLLKAEMEQKGKNAEFKVTHAAMPPSGTLPEGFRFMWHFMVDGKHQFRYTVKSADIGKPDAVAGTGTERIGTVDVDGVFRLETCEEAPGPALTLVNCVTVEESGGVFDPATASFTIEVPLKSIKAKKGSTIAGSTHAAGSTSCVICWVPHYAERSLTPVTIIDSAAMTGVFKVK